MKFDAIPKEVLEVAKTLENKGFEAFLVGGCVRDLILKREPKDWDITTNATPDQIISLFPETFYENRFGTVGVKTESENPKLKVIEVTPYRLEMGYSDNRHPDEVKFSQKLEDDLQRRDFTINAIAYSVSKGQLIDLYKGQEDIKGQVIRTVGDADTRFGEDALRMLRAIRFSAELGFMINIDTLASIDKNHGFMRNISKERIKDEFSKILMSKNPMIGLGLAQKMGILPFISEKLEEMVGVEQNKQAHLYDVWEHSLRALQHAADKGFDLETRLAALFHDIAKPETKRVTRGTNGGEDKTSFLGHEVIGARVTRETLKSLTFSKDITEKVGKLVRWHMFFSDTEEITLSAVRRLVRNVGPENIWDLINLRICDRIGTGRPKEEPYRLRKFQSMIEEVMRDPITVKMLKIDGNVIINELKIAPGPVIGNILNALLEEVLENPALNTEEYLKNKALELSKLSEKDLIELGRAARESNADADEAEIKKLREKRFVK
ncbi:MAG: HD domain-containing protein [Candidatus Pacebacteria bacterium]|nr:HD domain-containing protein [Candidatus Paceibacterota bacterium]